MISGCTVLKSMSCGPWKWHIRSRTAIKCKMGMKQHWVKLFLFSCFLQERDIFEFCNCSLLLPGNQKFNVPIKLLLNCKRSIFIIATAVKKSNFWIRYKPTCALAAPKISRSLSTKRKKCGIRQGYLLTFSASYSSRLIFCTAYNASL